MANRLSDDEIYALAEKRVKEKKDFYVHLSVYVVVNAMLVLIWYFTHGGYKWFVWPLACWGIGIIFHGLDVFLFHRKSNWEMNEIEKEAEKIRKTLRQ